MNLSLLYIRQIFTSNILELLASGSSSLLVGFILASFPENFYIESPPIQPFIDAGVIPRLIEILDREDEQQLQVDSLYVCFFKYDIFRPKRPGYWRIYLQERRSRPNKSLQMEQFQH